MRPSAPTEIAGNRKCMGNSSNSLRPLPPTVGDTPTRRLHGETSVRTILSNSSLIHNSLPSFNPTGNLPRKALGSSLSVQKSHQANVIATQPRGPINQIVDLEDGKGSCMLPIAENKRSDDDMEKSTQLLKALRYRY